MARRGEEGKCDLTHFDALWAVFESLDRCCLSGNEICGLTRAGKIGLVFVYFYISAALSSPDASLHAIFCEPKSWRHQYGFETYQCENC